MMLWRDSPSRACVWTANSGQDGGRYKWTSKTALQMVESYVQFRQVFSSLLTKCPVDSISTMDLVQAVVQRGLHSMPHTRALPSRDGRVNGGIERVESDSESVYKHRLYR